MTSYEERSSEPLELSASSPNGSFSSHIEIKGIKPRPFSRIRAMMSDPFFDMPFPRLSMRPHIKASTSSRSGKFATDSSGYGSGSSSSGSVFEEGRRDDDATSSESSAVSKTNNITKTTPVFVRAESQPAGESKSSLKDSMIRALDELDARVSFLRETANELEEEKRKLVFALHSIENHNQLNQIEQIDREEVLSNTGRLILTLDTVKVSVVTRRTGAQEAAILSVNALLDFLDRNLKSDVPADRTEAMRMVQILLNTCSSTDSRGVIDEKFQKQVIECAGE